MTNENQDLDGTEVDDIETPEDKAKKPVSVSAMNATLAKERAKHAKEMAELRAAIEGLKVPPQEEKKLSARDQELEELRRTVKDLNKAQQESLAEKRDSNLRSAAAKELRGINVPADNSDHALAFLVDAKKAIKYNQDGQIVMTVNGIEYDDLTEGMQAWSQTGESKLYKAPSGAKGSGAQSIRNSIEKMNQTGKLDLKYKSKELVDRNPDKTSLSKESRIAMSKLLADRLLAK